MVSSSYRPVNYRQRARVAIDRYYKVAPTEGGALSRLIAGVDDGNRNLFSLVMWRVDGLLTSGPLIGALRAGCNPYLAGAAWARRHPQPFPSLTVFLQRTYVNACILKDQKGYKGGERAALTWEQNPLLILAFFGGQPLDELWHGWPALGTIPPL